MAAQGASIWGRINGAQPSEVCFLPVRLAIRLFFAARRQTLLSGLVLACAAFAAGQPVLAQQAPSAPSAPPARFVVVLDAAHGGDDAGGRFNNGQLEKAFTLAMSVRLRSLLAARGIQVVTTRESDTAIDANKRAEIANHAAAQACLSLHASESGSGIHLFASSLAPAQPTRFAAWKTAQAAWVTRSLALEGVFNSALAHAGMTVSLGRTTLPPLDSMTCPAIAIEVAPERSPGKDNITAELTDPDYQARVAGALAAALVQWRTEARQP
jgi:N-acetylmuramoyl-L-alanine amidase